MIKANNIDSKTSRISFQYSILLIVIYSLILVYIDYINHTFWYDEAYSIALIKYSYQDILSITAKDVHPPLYYFLLKTFTSIFGNNFFTLHFFSTLGIIAILIIGLCQIRRILGNKVSSIFIVLICILPISQYLGVEIRMYSWLMLFILLSSIYGYEAITSHKRSSYLKFTICAICAAYTHNYGLVAVGAIYIYMLIDSLIKRQHFVPFIISLIVFVAVYGLWLPILFSQILDVKHSYWIKAITAKDILLMCYYFFSPKEPSHPYLIFSIQTMSIALCISLFIIALIFVLLIKNRKEMSQINLKAGNFFLYIFLFTIGTTLIFSYSIKPILAPRFTTSVLGTLLLSISIYVSSCWNSSKLFRRLCYSISIIFTIFSVARFFSGKKYFEIKKAEQEQLILFINANSNNQIFIAPFDLYPELAKLSLLFPDNIFYLYSPNDRVSYVPFEVQVIERIPKVETFYWIDEPIENGNTIFADRELTLKKHQEYRIHSVTETSDVRISKLIKIN